MDEEQRDGSRLLFCLIPFGEIDIDTAVSTLMNASVEFEEFAEYVNKHVKNTEANFFDLDICGLVYEFLLKKVSIEIQTHTAQDICDETNIYAVFNFQCSSFDKYEKAHKIAETISVEDRNDLVIWFLSETE